MGLLIVAGLAWFGLIKNKSWDGKSDLKLAIIGRESIGMVSISPDRKMINIMKIDGGIPLWLPMGLSWYQTDKVSRLLDLEENKGELSELMMFYNFGFTADKVFYLNDVDRWRDNKLFIGEFGLINWLKFRQMSSDMIYKEEIIDKNLSEAMIMLDEVMMRDFADGRVLTSDLRINVINTSDESGLANFLGTKLEWAGYSVVGVESGEENVENCLLTTSREYEDDYSIHLLTKLFPCEVVLDDQEGQQEVELYFGGKFAEMIKYSSYVRTF